LSGSQVLKVLRFSGSKPENLRTPEPFLLFFVVGAGGGVLVDAGGR
jgi:hypothetical protein